MDSNYLEFENKFRGNPESIRNQFSCYNSLIEKVIADIENPKFIDIGSGRGEWIQNWNKKIKDCYGLEINSKMVELTRDMGLNILQGDAITSLKGFSSSTISVITIFHMIEHLKYEELIELLSECYRVLSPCGVLIMETPSIDNIIVSTNTFYIDHTHINHIHPESLIFELDKIGYDHSKFFHIHGGPMQNDKFSKITRILNGVAQDILFVSTKEEQVSKNIFDKNEWLSEFQIGITTMQAAIDFDLRNEKIFSDLNLKIRDLNEKNLFWEEQIINQRLVEKSDILFLNDIDILIKPIKIIISLLKIIKQLIQPFRFIYKLIKIFLKRLIRLMFKILFLIINISMNHKLFKKIICSELILHIFQSSIELIPDNLIVLGASRVKANLKKIINVNARSSQLNKKLSFYYKIHLQPKNIKKMLTKKFQNK
tara:strand:+ start:1677 stop:2957 length:1281 start_codon:yes stop_codon:yes gene_type:complete